MLDAVLEQEDYVSTLLEILVQHVIVPIPHVVQVSTLLRFWTALEVAERLGISRVSTLLEILEGRRIRAVQHQRNNVSTLLEILVKIVVIDPHGDYVPLAFQPFLRF